MNARNVVTLLLVACILLAGCVKTELPSEPTVEASPTASLEVRLGIYMSNDPADFPFPTSGYEVYFVGESHGNRETKMIFQSYLERLYKEAGLRDVILEEDQAFETDANAYASGATDELIRGLCLRTDILGQIREFNASLPENEKVRVHLVDVDSPFPTIYKHLTELKMQLGAAGDSIEISFSSDFANWTPEQREELIQKLREASEGQPRIGNGLDTVALSLEWFFLGNTMDIKMPYAQGGSAMFAPIREDVITKNIEYTLSQLNGKPVLAFFGANHGIKSTPQATLPEEGFKTWTHRLVESDVNVYSVVIIGTSGKGFWRGESFEYEVVGEQQYEGIHGYRFQDGTTLVSLFETHPESNILYTDLRTEENATIQLPGQYDEMPASQVFDGLVIFEEFTPMEDACP